MFDDDLIGFSFEAVDFEASECEHVVVVVCVVDGYEVV